MDLPSLSCLFNGPFASQRSRFVAERLWFGAAGLRFRVRSSRLRGLLVSGLGRSGFWGFRVSGLFLGLGFRVQGSRFRAWGLGFRA